MSQKRVLIVEDDAIIALSLRSDLQREGFEVCGMAPTGERALAMAGEYLPDVVLMDVGLRGDMDGIEAGRRIHEVHRIPIVFISGFGRESVVERAAPLVPLACLDKPVSIAELRAALGRLE